jgi:undecaprenyl-diphosphatase
MTIIQAIILGLIQGITEFVPVSSSGHLVLAHHFLNITTTGLSFDVALHLGTLIALILFFYKDLWKLAKAIFTKQNETKLAWLLVLATVPAVIIGVLLEKSAESAFRSPRLVAFNFIIVSFVMLLAEWYYKNHVKNPTKLENTKTKQAIIIGLSQAAAVVPGISRSGSTITAGIFSGMDRVAATRFSFLLGIPITAGAILKVFTEHGTFSQFQSEKTVFLVGIVTALISGVFAIKFLLSYLSKHTLAVFAYYRLAVAALVLTLLFFKF